MHFSLIVITKPDQTIEDMLRPFEEQWEDGDVYADWVDETDEYRRKYEGEGEEFFYDPKSAQIRMYEKYDDVFRKPETRNQPWFCGDQYEVPEWLRRVEVPFAILYPDFDTFMAEYYKMEPNEFGEYGHWENPNGKWDWYQVGGRWAGLIEATDGEYGERSWGNEDEPYEKGHYDTALMTDVTSIDPSCVHDVLTPDEVWHECETWHDELKSDEHPWGTFVKDPTFKTDFKKRFLDPYPDCRVTVVDYHS